MSNPDANLPEPQELFKQAMRLDGIIVELDLKSAYPTAYAIQPSIDYKSHTRTLHSIDDIVALHKDLSTGVPHVYAFVDFEFPESTLYPCIPLTGEFGLVHFLCGEGIPATGVENALAVSMGTDVRLSRGESALSLPFLLRGELLGDFEVDFIFADFFCSSHRRTPQTSQKVHQQSDLQGNLLQANCPGVRRQGGNFAHHAADVSLYFVPCLSLIPHGLCAPLCGALLHKATAMRFWPGS